MGKILVLEDEESVNRGITLSVEKSGHTAYSCYTIEEAKSKTVQEKPDLIICDINLPDGNGLEYVSWIRDNSKAYVICLTALDQEIDQVMGYEAGADDYITKPFSLSVLMLKVEALFKRNVKEKEETWIESGKLRINCKELKLMVNEDEVSLTKNEWKLIQFFLAHSRQVLSKQQILECIFDIDGEFIDENTLAVNIRRLREKIEDIPSKPNYIKNIRGLGYIWDMEVR